MIRYVCLSVGKTERSTQDALMFIIVCGCMLVSMWRGMFCQCGCVTVVVRDSRVNGVIFVETVKCAFELVNNLLIIQVMQFVCA